MGMIGTLLGTGLGHGAAAARVGEAVGSVAEVFVGNRAERDAASAAGFTATVGQYGAEFASAGDGPFDRFVNALNRLPRPMLALGTLGLFVYAMAEPSGFSVRMEGLNLVPEPLWWLLGAIVSFYFGARELHHQRQRGAVTTARAILAGTTSRPGGDADTALDASPDEVADAAPEAGMVPVARPIARPITAPAAARVAAPKAARAARTAVIDPDGNAAVEAWRRQHP